VAVLLDFFRSLFSLRGLDLGAVTTARSLNKLRRKSIRFVGHAFRHDIKAMFPSGVLTPEGD
jgi:hypothetical protein